MGYRRRQRQTARIPMPPHLHTFNGAHVDHTFTWADACAERAAIEAERERRAAVARVDDADDVEEEDEEAA